MVYFGEVAAKGDAASLTRLLNQGIWVTFALLMPIAVGIWFVGEPLLILVAGEEYRHLTGVFGLLVLTLIGQSLIVAYGTQVLMVQGRGLLLNGALFGATLLGLALAPPLSKEFGMFGIAAVTLLTRTLAGVALAVGARRHVERYPWRECASTVLPALGMAAVLAALSNGNLWHDLALGAGAYALLFLATNVQAVRRLWPR
jgi:O-antigen/teichoic acid export membrane protein